MTSVILVLIMTIEKPSTSEDSISQTEKILGTNA